MEGLRGLAVFLVFFVHYQALFAFLLDASPTSSYIANLAAFAGLSGVDIFFVLSGYLIYGAALKPNLNFRRFMARRAERIYPVYLVVLAMYLCLYVAFPGRSRLPEEPLTAALYLLANVLFLPGIFDITPIILVAWSLSYEFLYYLFLPAFALLTGFAHWNPRARVRLIVCATAVLLIGLGLFDPKHSQLVMFPVGILVYEFVQRGKSAGSISTPVEVLLGTLFIVTVVLSGYLSQPSRPLWLPQSAEGAAIMRIAALGISISLLTFCCFHWNGLLRRAFSWAPLRYWGNISYSYYLLHGLVLHASVLALAKLFPQATNSAVLFWGLMPVALAVTILASSVLFALVEKPFSLRAPRSHLQTQSPAYVESAEPLRSSTLMRIRE